RRLTLLAAGPGFGKSTLLAAWRQLESARRAVAWLTLSEAENDPATLCMYVAGAVRAVRPDFGSDVEAVAGTPAPPVAGTAGGISNEIAGGPALALVLDDFHRVKSRAAQEVVGWLVDNCSSGLQLVVATRSDPGLPLGSLRAHGELVELRAADLAFTAAEAAE